MRPKRVPRFNPWTRIPMLDTQMTLLSRTKPQNGEIIRTAQNGEQETNSLNTQAGHFDPAITKSSRERRNMFGAIAHKVKNAYPQAKQAYHRRGKQSLPQNIVTSSEDVTYRHEAIDNSPIYERELPQIPNIRKPARLILNFDSSDSDSDVSRTRSRPRHTHRFDRASFANQRDETRRRAIGLRSPRSLDSMNRRRENSRHGETSSRGLPRHVSFKPTWALNGKKLTSSHSVAEIAVSYERLKLS